MKSQALVERRGSDVLYDEIAASRNSLRRDSVRLIKVTCDQMEKDKVQMSVAEVVRRCGKRGPAYSTVSNTGSKLGDYIKLRITEQESNLAAPRRRLESIADTVLDPVVRAQVREKESTARWLQRENDSLRHLFKNMRPGFDIDRFVRGESDGTLPPLPVSEAEVNAIAQFSKSEVGGLLLKLMDHLVGSRQYRQLNGRLTINMKTILDSRDMKVVRDVTGLSDDEWKKRFDAPDSVVSKNG